MTTRQADAVNYTDATGHVWAFAPALPWHEGHVGGRPFETCRYRVDATPGRHTKDDVAAIATAAFADRHDGRCLQGLTVTSAGPSFGRFYVTFKYGPPAAGKGEQQ